ncbi:MAG TPA: carboxylating nicotinate-nucleotide diphosphorylase [Thermoleophilia bacterium]|nr:carboxylating nicotinate-nucleotide diphosphorylase [Thermoleophilia bacterium]
MTAGLSEQALRAAAEAAAHSALAEDLAGLGDLAGRAFPAPGTARVEARADGVLSGVAAFTAAARLVDPELRVALACAAGERFAAGDNLVSLDGRLSSILALERTGLNFLARLSGVATLTARYVAETSGTGATIAGTRKTTPGLRALEKQAIADGGGSPHRFGLFDGAMIKDNHVAAAGSLGAAVTAVRAGLTHAHLLEAEVDTLEQLDEALAAGVTVILLDNMDVATVGAAVTRVAGRAVLEVSGGVTLESVRAYAETGVQVISVGALTTAAPWTDLSMVVVA